EPDYVRFSNEPSLVDGLSTVDLHRPCRVEGPDEEVNRVIREICDDPDLGLLLTTHDRLRFFSKTDDAHSRASLTLLSHRFGRSIRYARRRFLFADNDDDRMTGCRAENDC